MSQPYGIGPAHLAMTRKCVEPVKRNKDGWQWIVHRFPIKGGISLRDAMIRDMCQPNPLMSLIRIADGAN